MTLNSYLYTFVITGICLALMLGFLSIYIRTHKRSPLLMCLLYSVYVFSELVRNLTLLMRPGQPYIPSVLVCLSCLLMELLYGLILWDQANRPVSKAELIVLILLGTFAAVLSFFPASFLLSDSLSIYIFIWGIFKLRPVRKRDRRTYVLFILSIIFSTFYVVLTLLYLSSHLKLMFAFTPFFLTTPLGELMFYVTIAASTVDLFSQIHALKRPLPSDPPTAASPIPSISAQFALSPREQDVLALIAQGKSAKEIGQELFISEGTVKVHTHNIYQKLGISSRRQVYQLMMEYQTGQKS